MRRLGWDGKDEIRPTRYQILPNFGYVYTVDQFLKDGFRMPLLRILLPTGYVSAVLSSTRAQKERMGFPYKVPYLDEEGSKQWNPANSRQIEPEGEDIVLRLRKRMEDKIKYKQRVLDGQHQADREGAIDTLVGPDPRTDPASQLRELYGGLLLRYYNPRKWDTKGASGVNVQVKVIHYFLKRKTCSLSAIG